MKKESLENKKCLSPEGNMKPFSRSESENYLKMIPGWEIDEKTERTIAKKFEFNDFLESINFVKKVANIAESEGHHPDIHIFFNKVLLELSTHAIGGLSENDFIMAAKINTLKS